MAKLKSLEELRKLVNSVTIDELKKLVNADDTLASQISFNRPKDAATDEDCEVYVKDPGDGWVCIEPKR